MLKIINFAMRNSFRRKTVLLFAVLGISVSIMLQLTMASMSLGITQSFSNSLEASEATIYITETTDLDIGSVVPLDSIDLIRHAFEDHSAFQSISDISYLPGTFLLNYSLAGALPGIQSSQISIMGIDLDSYVTIYDDLDSLTNASTYFSTESEIVISQELYEINPELFNIGNNITFSLNTTEYIEFSVVGISNSTSSFQNNLALNIWMNRSAVQNIKTIVSSNSQLLVTSPSYIHYTTIGVNVSDFESNHTSEIIITTTPIDVDGLQQLLDNIFFLLLYYYPTLHLDIWSEGGPTELVSEALTSMGIFLDAIGYIVLFVGAIVVFISQMVGIDSRMKEFAIMKATGWKNGSLALEVSIESIMYGLLGTAIGVILTFIYGENLANQLQGRIFAALIIEGQIIIQSIFWGIGMGIFGGLYPSLIAGMTEPVEILK